MSVLYTRVSDQGPPAVAEAVLAGRPLPTEQLLRRLLHAAAAERQHHVQDALHDR